jgi:holliday junction DNA helicase RuvA
MIGRLRGQLVTCAPGDVLVDVGGVGYEVQIPLSTFYALSGRSGGVVELLVHTHVREDVLQLYGFATAKERALFQRLIGISGVGPRIALAVLSGIGADELERAVLTGDRGRLEKVPGIGRKTAERILLELRDRLERDGRPSRRRGAPPEGGVPGDGRGGPRADAVSALVHLGYSLEAAGRAVDEVLSAPGGEPTLEELLKASLKGLVR